MTSHRTLPPRHLAVAMPPCVRGAPWRTSSWNPLRPPLGIHRMRLDARSSRRHCRHSRTHWPVRLQAVATTRPCSSSTETRGEVTHTIADGRPAACAPSRHGYSRTPRAERGVSPPGPGTPGASPGALAVLAHAARSLWAGPRDIIGVRSCGGLPGCSRTTPIDQERAAEEVARATPAAGRAFPAGLAASARLQVAGRVLFTGGETLPKAAEAGRTLLRAIFAADATATVVLGSKVADLAQVAVRGPGASLLPDRAITHRR